MTNYHEIIRDLLVHVDDEIEQRKHGGNGEDWGELQALSDRGHAALEQLAPLMTAMRDILAAEADFSRNMPDGWEGDPLSDACERARRIIEGQPNTPFHARDVAVSLTGFQWTALLGRLVRPDELSDFGRAQYLEATTALRAQLLAASEAHPSPYPTLNSSLFRPRSA